MSEGYVLLEPLGLLYVSGPRTTQDRVGHAGLIIVHAAGGAVPYSAYDAACPRDWPTLVAVQPVPEQTLEDRALVAVQCPKCRTMYDLTMGVANPISGPGRAPLMQYACRRMDDRLLITN